MQTSFIVSTNHAHLPEDEQISTCGSLYLSILSKFTKSSRNTLAPMNVFCALYVHVRLSVRICALNFTK